MRTRITEGPVHLRSPTDLRRWSLRCHAAGMSVGLVPTMGALHRGHGSLIRRSAAECDRSVVSIFVNPAQFGPSEDFASYPRSIDADIELLRREGASAVFLPSAEDMYPAGSATEVRVDAPFAARFEGASRPGHFDGVALVVAKLFNAASPDRAYFGRKDAQQCAVVSRLAADLDTGIEVVTCPTIRDADGLALSSRNAYLSAEERRRALAIPTGLARAAQCFEAGTRDAVSLRNTVTRELEHAGLVTDYVALVNEDFADADEARFGSEILVAAKIGRTRLIDQMRLGLDDAPVVVGAAGAACNGSS